MKKILFSFLAILHLAAVSAQTVSLQKYSNGTTQYRFYIRHQDTILKESFLENGTILERRWRDSCHIYHPNVPNQRIRRQIYRQSVSVSVTDVTIHQIQFVENWDYQGYFSSFYEKLSDSTAQYIQFSPQKDTLYVVKSAETFAKRTTLTISKPLEHKYERIIADSGKHLQESWLYLNQQLHHYRLDSLLKYPLWIHTIYYDSLGQVAHIERQIDSLELRPDKDNVLCLYGFRNAQHQWVHAPQYESIQKGNALFIANQQNKYGVLNKYGKIMVPFEWDYLSILSGSNQFDPLGKRLSRVEYPQRFQVRRGSKWGVLDGLGKIILAPDYNAIENYKNDLYAVKKGSFWGIVDTNGQFVVSPKQEELSFTEANNVFKNTIVRNDTILQSPHLAVIQHRKYGLIGANDKIILPPLFYSLSSVDSLSFWAQTHLNAYQIKRGLFHLNKGWIVDTLTHVEIVDNHFCIFTNAMKQMSLYDIKKQEWLLLFDYQEIISERALDGQDDWSDFTKKFPPQYAGIETRFYIKKAGKWGLFDAMQRNWILPIQYDKLFPFGDKWITAQGGLWRFMDSTGHFIGRTFDGGGLGDEPVEHDELKLKLPIAFMAKGNRMAFFHPFSGDSEININPEEADDDSIELEHDEHTWIINRQHQILVKPHQAILTSDNKHWLVRDTTTKQLQIIDIKGRIKPFLSKYKISDLNVVKNSAVVRDSITNRFGLMTLEQKTIMRPIYFGITPIDSMNRFWVRNDLELPKTASNRTKIMVDSNWQMFNEQGKLMTSTIFDYPFGWHHGLGIGSVRGKKGLWNAQGKIILAARYDKIWYDPLSTLFYLFRNVGDKDYKIGFANSSGQVLVEAELLNMSLFLNNCALVETAEGYGVIQSNGQYLVAPAPNALQQTPFSISQRLRTHYFSKNEDDPSYLHRPPYSIAQMNAITDTAQRRVLENLLLEQEIAVHWLNGEQFPDYLNVTCYIQPSEWAFSRKTGLNNLFHANRQYHLIKNFHASSDVLQYAVERNKNLTYPICIWYNFKKKNHIWTFLPLEDIVWWNPTTIAGLNQLLLDKIALLQYKNLNCSASGTFIEQVKNRFYYQKEGLAFYFDAGEDKDWKSWNTSFPTILLTWAELATYLK
jgi:hypothetical protein